MRWNVCWTLLLATFLASSAAWGGEPSSSDRESARALLAEGDKASAAGDHATALKSFEAAHALVNFPSTAMAVARERVALGQLIEAREIALSVNRIPKAAAERDAVVQARKEAEKLAEDLGLRIPSVVVEVAAPAGTKTVIEIDGATVPEAAATAPRKVNPGPRKIKVTAAGYKDVELTVDVQEKEAKKVPVTLEPASGGADVPTAPPEKKDPAPFTPPIVDEPTPDEGSGVSPLVPVGFAIGGAGLITGLVGGIVSLTQVSSAKDEHGCTETCPASEQTALEADLDSARTSAWVSNIGLAVGGAGVILGVVGIVITVTDDSDGKEAARAWRVRTTGTGLSLEGRF
jgi:hypothetical protein